MLAVVMKVVSIIFCIQIASLLPCLLDGFGFFFFIFLFFFFSCVCSNVNYYYYYNHCYYYHTNNDDKGHSVQAIYVAA